MYTAYFGLSEAPFSISPDPAYLFMSDRHREALAHLTHGLGDGGGFVLLTGEVGTGKTTISRTVMEKLPENTQAAIILNPTLSCEELLATICDNLKIRYKKTGATLKYLTDKIQDKLLKNHQAGINTLVIIDEAQHLQPEVLEQLRLLTNLETNTQKLLQVILIGQPELQQLLQRRDLRQLAQRITARYHLLPLTKPELQKYIEHRLSVAQCTRDLFNRRAVDMIHKVSGGIPRIINLLCDRALILAYNANQSMVSRKIVLQAADEALAHEHHSVFPFPKVIAIAASIGVAVVAGYLLANYSLVEANIEPNTNVVANTKGFEDETKVNVDKAPVEQLLAGESPNQSAANQSDMNQQQITSQHHSNNDKASPDVLPKEVIETIEKEPEPIVVGYQPERIENPKSDKPTIKPEANVSADLLAKFNQAVEDTKTLESDNEAGPSTETFDDSSVQAVHELPAKLQNDLPVLKFEMHIFATEGEGWVRVNGEDKREGEQIAKGVWLDKILPQKVILTYQQQQFSMTALSSW